MYQEVNPGHKRKLHCEKIEYNKKTGEIKLFGEAIIEEPTGEIIKASNVQLDDKLKKAVIKALLVIMNDNAKVKAKSGQKQDNIYTFKEASYTPCNETACSTPLWDLFADEVIYDSKKKTFVYHRVKLRFKGKPVFYTPYFTHPSFEVKRRSGFVTPILSLSRNTGTMLGLPFFITLGKHQDLKITPFLNSQRRGFLVTEYRRAFYRADLNINASILTKSRIKDVAEEEKRTRWHISTLVQTCNINNRRITFKINRASDVTYLSKYPAHPSKYTGFIQRKCYESKMAFDFFDKNYFITADSYMFQTPDQATSPMILPHLSVNYEQPSIFNGFFGFDSDTVCLSRNQAIPQFAIKDMFRSSNKFSWSKSAPVKGCIFDINCGLKTEIYKIDGEQKRDKLLPIMENQVSAFYPFLSKISDKQTSIWGPKVTLSSSETIGSKRSFVDNEDSIFSSFDDMNLYSINRYGSYGREENGEKIAAGLENSIYNSGRRYLNFFVGNSQNIGSKNKKPGKSGDAMMGRFLIKPTENISLRTRFVGLPGIQKSRMLESGIDVKISRFAIGCGYVHDSRSNEFRRSTISQIGVTLGYKLTKSWKIHYSSIYNLDKKLGDGNLFRGIFTSYEDECFKLSFGLYRSGYRDRDIKKDHGVVLSVSFKNLGTIGTPSERHLYKPSIGKIE